MGDTGSLAIGGAFGTVAILLKVEFLLVLIGGVFVAEAVSVMLQTCVYKWYKRTRGREYADAHRVFRMAPLHHHFEKLGWAETTVVTRFYILGILCALVGAGHAQAAMMFVERGGRRAGRWRCSGWQERRRRRAPAARRTAIAVYASDAGTGAGSWPRRRPPLRALGVAVAGGGHDLARIGGRRGGDRLAGDAARGGRRSWPRARRASRSWPRWSSGSGALPNVRRAGHDRHQRQDDHDRPGRAPPGRRAASAPRPPATSGRPLSEVAVRGDAAGMAGVELSSFQLHDMPTLAPTAGVLTNLAPDHLDRYPLLAEYYADKARLFRNASAGSIWISNADDPEVPADGGRRGRATIGGSRRRTGPTAGSTAARRAAPGRRSRCCSGGSCCSSATTTWPTRWRPRWRPRWRGSGRDALGDGLRSFRALPHRLEPVREVDGVLWINDSKATNVASTEVALSAARPPVRAAARRAPQGRAVHPPGAAAGAAVPGRGGLRRGAAAGGRRPQGAVPVVEAGDVRRGPGGGPAPGEAGRRRAALAGLLELRHVQELRGARRPLPRGGRGAVSAPVARHPGELRWETRLLTVVTATLVVFGIANAYGALSLQTVKQRWGRVRAEAADRCADRAARPQRRVPGRLPSLAPARLADPVRDDRRVAHPDPPGHGADRAVGQRRPPLDEPEVRSTSSPPNSPASPS